MKIFFLKPLAALAAFLSLSAFAWAVGGVISVKVNNTTSDDNLSGIVDAVDPHLRVANKHWNAITDIKVGTAQQSKTLATLMDNTGTTVTGATLVGQSYGSWTHDVTSAFGGMGNNYADGPWTVKVTNIPYQVYDVILYMATDNDEKVWGAVGIGDAAETETFTYYISGTGDVASTAIQAEETATWGQTCASTHGYGVDVIRIRNLTNPTLSFKTVKPTDSSRAGLHGFQIVDTMGVQHWKNATVGINFCYNTEAEKMATGDATATTPYGFNDGSRGGTLQAQYWQNVTGNNDGNAITINDTVNTDRTYALRFGTTNSVWGPEDGNNPQGGKLLSSYMDNASKFTLSGLPYSGYDVAIIFSGDGSSSGTGGNDCYSHVKVNGVAKTYNAAGELINGSAPWGKRYMQNVATLSATGTSTSGQVMFLSGLDTPSLTLETLSNSGDANVGRGTIAAIQIYIKEGVTAIPGARILSAGVNDWAMDNAWGNGIRNPLGVATMSAAETATVNMNEEGNLKELTIDGSGVVAFSGENQLTSLCTYISTDVDATAGVASLGAVTVAPEKTLTVPNLSAFSSVAFGTERTGVLEVKMPSAASENTLSFAPNGGFTLSRGILNVGNAKLNGAKTVTVSGADAKMVIIGNDPMNNAGGLVLADGATIESRSHFRLPASTTVRGVGSSFKVTGVNWDVWRAVSLRNITLEENATTTFTRGDDKATATDAGYHLWNTAITTGAGATMTISAPVMQGVDGSGKTANITSLTKSGAGELILTAPEAHTDFKIPSGATFTVNGGTLTLQPEASTCDLGGAALTVAAEATLKANIADAQTVTLANAITNHGTVEKTGAGTLELTGLNLLGGRLEVQDGALKVTSTNEPLAAGATVNVGTTTVNGETVQNVLELTGGGRYFGVIDGLGKTLVSGTFSLGASGSNKGSITTETLEVSGNLRYKAFAENTFEHNHVIVKSSGVIDQNTGEGASSAVKLKIATGKSLTNAGTIEVPVVFADGAIIKVAEHHTGTITKDVTLEGSLIVRISPDYPIPAGGLNVLSYTACTGTMDPTYQNVDGSELEWPATWTEEITETGVRITVRSLEATLPEVATTWDALSLAPGAMEDVTLTVDNTADLDIGETPISAFNNLILSGTGTLTLRNADKLTVAGEISVGEGLTLRLVGPTEGEPLEINATALTGAGSVEIEGQVKFTDMEVAVPVTTLAAQEGDTPNAIGTLTLENAADAPLVLSSAITNNGALVLVNADEANKLTLTTTITNSGSLTTNGPGTIALSDSGFTTTGVLTVATGILELAPALLQGEICVRYGATLVNQSSWTMPATASAGAVHVKVYGTLTMGETAWWLNQASSLTLGAGARVTGTGTDNPLKTIALGGALYIEDNADSTDKTVHYEALLSLETQVDSNSDGTYENAKTAVAIPEGVTVAFTKAIRGTGFAFSGGGTAVLSEANTYTGGTAIASGTTVKITHRDALGAASGTNTITGSGILVIATDNTGATGNVRKPLVNTKGLRATDWAGTVVVKTTGTAVWLQLGLYGHAASKIQCHGVTGFFQHNDTDSLTVTAPVELLKTDDRDGLTLDDGSSSDVATVTFAELTGAGKLELNNNNKYYTVKLNDVADYSGQISISHNRKQVIIAEATDTTTSGQDGTIVVATDVTAYQAWTKVAIAEGKTLSVQVEESAPMMWTGALSGNGTFKKTGAGTLTFSPASVADTITTDVAAGTLALGATAPKAIVVQGGATFDYAGVAEKVPGMITLKNGATLKNSGANVTTSNSQMTDITLDGDATIVATGTFGMIKNGYAAVTLNLNGHTLTKEGDSDFWFANTTINGGTGDTPGEIHVTEGAFTKTQDHATVIEGHVKLSATAENAFNFGSDTVTINGTLELGGNVTLGASPLTGAGMLVKSGTDTVVLTGNLSSFSGSIRVDAGTLDLSGAIAGATRIAIAGVAEGATLILPPAYDVDATLVGNAPTATYAVAAGATVAGTVKVTLNGVECSTSTLESDTLSFTGQTATSNPTYTGAQWWWDYEFSADTAAYADDGTISTVASTGSNTQAMTMEGTRGNSQTALYTIEGENKALFFRNTPYRPDGTTTYGNRLTAVMYCRPAAAVHTYSENGGNSTQTLNDTALISFGSSTKGSRYAITLATGDITKNEMQLKMTYGFDPYDSTDGKVKNGELVKLGVPAATTAFHLYAFSIEATPANPEVKGDTGSTNIKVYVDGKLRAAYTIPTAITLGEGFQIGSIHGGVKNPDNASQLTGLEKYPATINYSKDASENYTEPDYANEGMVDFLRVTDTILSEDAILALKNVAEYMYEPAAGTYQRTLSSNNETWVNTATKPWYKIASDGSLEASGVAYPPKGAALRIITEGTDPLTMSYDITDVADADLSENTVEGYEDQRNINYESLVVNGTAPLTIRAPENNTNTIILLDLTLGTPLTVSYDTFGLSTAGIELTGTTSSLTIDCADLVNRTWQTLSPAPQLTGVVPEAYGSRISVNAGETTFREVTCARSEQDLCYHLGITVPALKAQVSESANGTDWAALPWEADTAEGATEGDFTLSGQGQVNFAANTFPAEGKLTLAESAAITFAGTHPTYEALTLNASASLTTTAEGFDWSKVAVGTGLTVETRPTVRFNAGTATFTTVPHNVNATFLEGSNVTFSKTTEGGHYVCFKGSTLDIQTDMTLEGSRGIWFGATEGQTDEANSLPFATTLKVGADATVTLKKTGSFDNNDAALYLGAWGGTSDNQVLVSGNLKLEQGLSYGADTTSATIEVLQGGVLEVAETKQPSANSTVAVTVNDGGTMKWTGAIQGTLSLADGAIVDVASGVAPTVTGTVTYPTEEEEALQVVLPAEPTGDVLLLATANATVPAASLYLGSVSEATQTKAYFLKCKEGVEATEGVEAVTAGLYAVKPTLPGEDSAEPLPPAMEGASEEAQTKLAELAVDHKVERIDTVVTQSTSGSTIPDASIEALTLFTGLQPTVVTQENGETIATITYDFGIERLTVRSLTDAAQGTKQSYVVLAATVKTTSGTAVAYAADTAIEVACTLGDAAHSVTVTPMTAEEIAEVDDAAAEGNIKWYKIPLADLGSTLGTFNFSVKAKKATQSE